MSLRSALWTLAVLAAAAPAQTALARAPELAARAARLRGLPAPASLRFEERTEEDVAAETSGEELAPEDAADLAAADLLYERLGLSVPAVGDRPADGFDHALRRGLVAGFYDPTTRALVLVRSAGAPPAPRLFDRDWKDWLGPPFVDDEAATIVHEVGHALQHARAPRLFENETFPDGDCDLAVRALLEGDAVLLEAAFSLERAGVPPAHAFRPAFAAALAATFDDDRLDEADRRAAAADYLAARFDFPYAAGVRFATAVARRGEGFAALAAALDDPPLSTEQILHPEKWLGPARDHPIEVTEPDDWDGPPGFEIAVSDVLGEFGWRRRLAGAAGGPPPDAAALRAAKRGAEGWGGDSCVLYRDARGDVAVSALVVCDRPRDAEEFADVLAATLRREAPRPSPESAPVSSFARAAYFRAQGSAADAVFVRGDVALWVRDFPRRSLLGDAEKLLRNAVRRTRTKLP